MAEKEDQVLKLEALLKSPAKAPPGISPPDDRQALPGAKEQPKEDLTQARLERGKLKSAIPRLEKRLLRAGLTGEIGPVIAQSVLDFFSSRAGQEILRRLKDLAIAPRESTSRPTGPSETSQALRGKTFVLTGTLTGMTREETTKMIRDLGGNVSSSVSRKTSFLIMGADPGDRKVNQAKAFGVLLIGEKEFLAMITPDEVPAEPTPPEQEELF